MLLLVISSVLLTTIYAHAINYASLENLLYSDWISCDHNRSLDLDISDTMVYFYDFQENFNASFKIKDAINGLSAINKTRKLIFYVQGYKANITWSTSETIRQTFRSIPNIYLIIIDYSMFMYKGGKTKEFENSIIHSYYIGNALGELLAGFHAKGILSRNIHCIGTSLGGQILGYAGEAYMNRTSEKIWRITGLDPAGPCFANSDIKNQLRSGVAEYVEVYHCNAGILGTSSVLADIDIFVNIEGKIQPHCQDAPSFGQFEVAECSHKSCLMYWARTVEHPELDMALSCDSYGNFITGKCEKNDFARVGYYNSGKAFGVFYLNTEITRGRV